MDFSIKQVEKWGKKFWKNKYKELKGNLVVHCKFKEFYDFVKDNDELWEMINDCLQDSPFTKKKLPKFVQEAFVDKNNRYWLTYVQKAKEHEIINEKADDAQVVNYLLEDQDLWSWFDNQIVEENL